MALNPLQTLDRLVAELVTAIRLLLEGAKYQGEKHQEVLRSLQEQILALSDQCQDIKDHYRALIPGL